MFDEEELSFRKDAEAYLKALRMKINAHEGKLQVSVSTRTLFHETVLRLKH
jgi:hypothetical protein